MYASDQLTSLKSSTLLIIACLFVTFAMTGCVNSNEDPHFRAMSQRIESEIAQEEWAYTNKMAWPCNALTNEIVMWPGMQITASNASGTIAIAAGKGYERSYTWNRATRSAKLWARKARWHGKFGIYYPGPGEHWKSNGGITRGVLEEALLWFPNGEEAVVWLAKYQSRCVYTDDGLVVNWSKVPERKQLNVNVYQIMIAGEKPHSLRGAKNDLITVKSAGAADHF